MPKPQNAATSFVFENYQLSADGQRLEFNYSAELTDRSEKYREIVEFPVSLSLIDKPLLDKLLQNLHLMLGISYWKLYCAPIKVPYRLSLQQAQFWQVLYRKGLGEFFYQNKLDWEITPTFPAAELVFDNLALETNDQALLGFSGGKDSFVSLRLLEKSNIKFQPFIVATNNNETKMLEALRGVNNQEPFIIKRQLDPVLLQADQPGFKGHIPFSAVVAFLGFTLGVATKNRYVIVSNEQGSAEANTQYQGEAVNHQWSKSLKFEQLFRAYVKEFITSDIEYFSLLRPLSELKVVQLLSHDQEALKRFISCNKNFRTQNPLKQRWCNNCAKCASTFGLLSAFVDIDKLIALFNANLFKREDLIPLFKALAGIEGSKPFDCVGTVDEINAALAKAANENPNLPVLKALKPQLRTSDLKALVVVGSTASLPNEFRGIIENLQ